MEIAAVLKDRRCALCRKINADQEFNYLHHNLRTLKVSAARGCPICHFLHITCVNGHLYPTNATNLDQKLRICRRDSKLEIIDFSERPREFEFYRARGEIISSSRYDKFSSLTSNLGYPMPLDDQVDFRNLQVNPYSEACFKLAQEWIKSCLETHTLCKQSVQGIALPTRLIDVSKPCARLVKASRDSCSYICLSYCWGATSDNLSPTIASYANRGLSASCQEREVLRKCKYLPATLRDGEYGILMKSLPKTLQDAISITRRLNVKYLWVDLICIVQDSVEDWTYEASRMGDYYANSYLTLSALDSEHAEFGMFHKRQYKPSVRLEGNLFLRTATRRWREVFKDAPLSRRAWALQERILATRILHFGRDEMFWECLTCNERESKRSARQFIDTNPSLNRDLAESQDEDFKRMLLDCANAAATVSLSSISNKALTTWYRIIHQYSSLALTRPSDKLPAVSGLASKIQDILLARQTHSEDIPPRWTQKYIAGLWSGDLFTGLLWYNNGGSYSKRSNIYQAPSWSWASLNGPTNLMVDINSLRTKSDFDATINSFTSKPLGDPYGAVAFASISMSVLMKEVLYRGSKRDALYGDDELDLVIDILDNDGRRIGTGYLDIGDSRSTESKFSEAGGSCTAIWICERESTCTEGSLQPVVFFLLVEPVPTLGEEEEETYRKPGSYKHISDPEEFYGAEAMKDKTPMNQQRDEDEQMLDEVEHNVKFVMPGGINSETWIRQQEIERMQWDEINARIREERIQSRSDTIPVSQGSSISSMKQQDQVRASEKFRNDSHPTQSAQKQSWNTEAEEIGSADKQQMGKPDPQHTQNRALTNQTPKGHQHPRKHPKPRARAESSDDEELIVFIPRNKRDAVRKETPAKAKKGDSLWQRIGIGHTQDFLTKEVLGQGTFYDCEFKTIVLV